MTETTTENRAGMIPDDANDVLKRENRVLAQKLEAAREEIKQLRAELAKKG